MGTIGSIVVNLEANSAQFEKSTRKVNENLDEVKHHAEGLNFKELFAEGLSIGGAIEMIHMAGEAVEKLVDLGKEAVAQVAETVQEVTKTFRLAGTLNMPTDTLMAFQNAAKASGVDADVFTKALEHMQRSIGKGAEDGGRAAAAIDKLGLSSRDLANMGADKSFEAIADKIGGIENPTLRATAAADIFGSKVGQQLLPLLMQGAAGLEKFKEEGKEFGNTLDDIEAAKLVAVNEEFQRMGERMEGIKDRIVVAIAPALLSIGTNLEAIIPSADVMKEYILGALHAIGTGIGYTLDAWQLFKSGILEVASMTVGHLSVVIESIAMMGHGVEALVNLLPGMHVQFAETLDGVADKAQGIAESMHQQAAEEFNKPWPHEAVDSAFQHINQEADKAAADIASKHSNIAAPIDESFDKSAEQVTKTLDDLKKQVDEFGMSEGQKKLFEMKADKGAPEAIAQAQKYIDTLKGLEDTKKATDEVNKLKDAVAEFGMTAGQKKVHDMEALTGVDPKIIEQAKAFQKQLDELDKQKKLAADADEANKKMAEEGKKVMEEVETPTDKYNQKLEELNKLLKAGAINQETFGLATAKAAEELEKQNAEKHKKEEEKDHDKVASVIRRFDFRMPQAVHHADPAVAAQRQLLTVASQQLRASQRQTELQEEMYRFQRDNHDGTGNQNNVASIA